MSPPELKKANIAAEYVLIALEPEATMSKIHGMISASTVLK
jgi:hypothetical protein